LDLVESASSGGVLEERIAIGAIAGTPTYPAKW